MSWADLPPPSLLMDFVRHPDTPFVRGPGDPQLLPRAFSPFVTFTRASSATRVNAQGLIELVGNNVPRFDHDPATGAPRGLLIEGQRTNLLLESGDFTSTQWTSTGIASRTNNVIAPNNALAGCTFTEDASTVAHFFVAAGTNRPVPGAVPVTASLFMRGGSRRFVNVALENSGNGYNATIDTVDWVITQQSLTGTGWSAGSAMLANAGNGWWRVQITVTPPAATNAVLVVGGALTGATVRSVAYTGNESTLIAWGAQLEAGAFASSYIPTGAAQVTRAVEIATITGTNFSDWYRQDEGTFLAEAGTLTGTALGGAAIISVTDGTLGNRLQLNGGTQNAVFVSVGGVVQAAIDLGLIGTGSRLAGAFRQNDFAGSRNGGAVGTDTSGTMPTVDRAGIGQVGGVGGSQMFGHIRSITYWPNRLAAAQLQLTTGPLPAPTQGTIAGTAPFTGALTAQAITAGTITGLAPVTGSITAAAITTGTIAGTAPIFATATGNVFALPQPSPVFAVKREQTIFLVRRETAR